jgi:superfamily II DNA/RNA helicase
MQKELLDEITSRLGIVELNEMQNNALDTITREKEVLLLSPTGSGKTLGYLLPLVNLFKANLKTPQCLVLAPSRELALQIEQVWKKMNTGYKVNSLYGGHLLETEINNLTEQPALIIGTPGRIKDHITRGSFSTDTITTLILDEFDKSLALGFEEEMSFIIKKLPAIRKKVLVSATTAIEIPEFTGVKSPVVLDYISSADTSEALDLKIVISDEKDKVNTLFQLLCYIGAESTIVFCNHREAAERASKHIAERGIPNAFFHGGLEQMEREQTLTRFRNGSVNYLIATDLAARGLDIPAVKHIIHYHIPGSEDEFIHRNGRTARMNATGTAYLLLNQEEHAPTYLPKELEQIELPTECDLPPLPEWTTIYVSGGKKDKLNKVDIVGFFSKIGKLQKDDLGLIDVKDNISFAAVKKNKVRDLLHIVQNEKMKGKKYRIALAR